ncbi:LysE family translocator [Croceicoccus sp. Ery15]|uniref:LysE family translocator n=1 Tax=Croceicoccus sp. Ery15 TaxID=1703338 RepID=UPI001E35BC7D|nr:LysE family translocator [Croceicoccus sp. Ery15]
MNIGLLLSFWVVSLALAATPGADWAYVIASGLKERALVAALSGLMLGYVAITILVAAGVGALVAQAPSLMAALTALGVGYLIWLGIGMLRHPPVPAPAQSDGRTGMQRIATGFGISGLNPKALLLFLALLPQFTSLGAVLPVGMQLGVLGFVHIVNCCAVYALVGLGSRAVLRSRPNAARVFGRCSGAIMIVLAIALAADKIWS